MTHKFETATHYIYYIVSIRCTEPILQTTEQILTIIKQLKSNGNITLGNPTLVNNKPESELLEHWKQYNVCTYIESY